MPVYSAFLATMSPFHGNGVGPCPVALYTTDFPLPASQTMELIVQQHFSIMSYIVFIVCFTFSMLLIILVQFNSQIIQSHKLSMETRNFYIHMLHNATLEIV